MGGEDFGQGMIWQDDFFMVVIAFCYFSFDDLQASMIISFEQPASLDEEDFRFSHQDLYVANLKYDLTRHFIMQQIQNTTTLQKTCCIAAISANINNATISENTINGQQKTQSNNQKNKQSSCLEWPFNRSLEAFVPRLQETQCSMFCFLRCQEESYQQFRG